MDQGKIYFWQFVERRQWRGWNIAFDERGLVRLLDELRRLRAAESGNPASGWLSVLRPSRAVLAVVGNRGGRPESPMRLRLHLDAGEDRWALVEDSPEVVLHIDSRRLGRVIEVPMHGSSRPRSVSRRGSWTVSLVKHTAYGAAVADSPLQRSGVGGMSFPEAASQMRTAFASVGEQRWRQVVHPAMAPYALRKAAQRGHPAGGP